MTTGEKFEQLMKTVTRLREPDGCPWDREQTHASLLPFFLEETYEVMESVDEEDWATLKEELGDVLLHVVMQARIAEEDRRFSIDDSLDRINEKLIRRHPHVFGDAQADASFHAKQNWEAAKHKEKGRASRLDGVPVSLPGLVRAQRLQEKASYVGFDWDEIKQVWGKVHEEISELKEAESNGSKPHIEEEIGDVLFAIVNLSRTLKISAEDALRKTNVKFIRRFKFVEQELKKKDIPIEKASLAEMDAIWEQAKQKERLP